MNSCKYLPVRWKITSLWNMKSCRKSAVGAFTWCEWRWCSRQHPVSLRTLKKWIHWNNLSIIKSNFICTAQNHNVHIISLKLYRCDLLWPLTSDPRTGSGNTWKTLNSEDKEPEEEQRRILLPGTDRRDINVTSTEQQQQQQHDNNS